MNANNQSIVDQLKEIEGIGPARAKKIVAKYPTYADMAKATSTDMAKETGVPADLCLKVSAWAAKMKNTNNAGPGIEWIAVAKTDPFSKITVKVRRPMANSGVAQQLLNALGIQPSTAAAVSHWHCGNCDCDLELAIANQSHLQRFTAETIQVCPDCGFTLTESLQRCCYNCLAPLSDKGVCMGNCGASEKDPVETKAFAIALQQQMELTPQQAFAQVQLYLQTPTIAATAKKIIDDGIVQQRERGAGRSANFFR